MVPVEPVALPVGSQHTQPVLESAISQTQLRKLRELVARICAGVALLLLFAFFALRHWRQPDVTASAIPRISSIAVLPLENLSNDPEQEYFVEGMTDEIITDLAKLPGVRVISRTSAIQYKGTHKTLPQIPAN